jgi:hypothetical protein
MYSAFVWPCIAFGSSTSLLVERHNHGFCPWGSPNWMVSRGFVLKTSKLFQNLKTKKLVGRMFDPYHWIQRSDMRQFHLAEEKPEAPMKPVWKVHLCIRLAWACYPPIEGNLDSFGSFWIVLAGWYPQNFRIQIEMQNFRSTASFRRVICQCEAGSRPSVVLDSFGLWPQRIRGNKHLQVLK